LVILKYYIIQAIQSIVYNPANLRLPDRDNIAKRVKISGALMSRISSLNDIKLSALFLQNQLVGTDPEKVKAAYDDFQALVDRFYSENPDIVSERQHRSARDNFDFFIVLVDTALNRCLAEEERSADPG
jgi:hypothetical protein